MIIPVGTVKLAERCSYCDAPLYDEEQPVLRDNGELSFRWVRVPHTRIHCILYLRSRIAVLSNQSRSHSTLPQVCKGGEG